MADTNKGFAEVRAELRRIQSALDRAEEQVNEISALWTRWDDALDALNTREDEIGPSAAYVLGRLLSASKRALDDKDTASARLMLDRAEELLR